MDIKEKFLELTKSTYPYGTEHLLKEFLPINIEEDKYGNFFIKIGESSTMFTCHLDTASRNKEKVNHIIDGKYIRTDKSTILGADDKAGMTILLYMIENNVPGLYYFFCGEEVGCVGSNYASKLDFSTYNKCVSFDRRAYHSVITHQFGERCCSDFFAEVLSQRLNKHGNFKYEPDPTGIITDSASFMYNIKECTNISVGYFKEHTVNEYQDINFLTQLCKTVIKIDWETLPIERNITTYVYNESFVKEEYSDTILDIWIEENKHQAKIKSSRVDEERKEIYEHLCKLGYGEITDVTWDGKNCYLVYRKGDLEFLADRTELMDLIPSLYEIDLDDLYLLT